MSFFFALKGMANTPVESMKDGGLFWFTDLTICDPYYILPMLTSITVWATIEVKSFFFFRPTNHLIHYVDDISVGNRFSQAFCSRLTPANLFLQSYTIHHVSHHHEFLRGISSDYILRFVNSSWKT